MGTLDIQHRIILKRLNYYKRLQTKQEEAIKKIIRNQHTNSWTTITKLIVTGIGLKDEDLIQQSKNNIKKAVTIKMKQTIKQSVEEKSKYTFLTTNKYLNNSVETDYLSTLTRNQARALFSARTRMTKAKANYKNMHATQTCRGCGLADETQHNILENCASLHKDDETTVPLQDLFDHGNKHKTANTQGSSTEPDEKKVGLLLNHIGEEGLDIYDTFTFLPARPNPIQGQPALPMEDPNHSETVLEKYADYLGRRDPQLMLREKFWFHLKREPSQTLESWVLVIKKLAAECKFPATYMNQAVRDKLTFSCTDEATKSKLYDVGSGLTLDRAIEILYQKETTKYELQESKSAHIDVVKSKAKKKTSQGSQSKPAPKQYKSGTQGDKVECGYCGGNHPKCKKNCPAANHKFNERCNIKGHFAKKCRTSPARVAQIAERKRKDDSEDEGSQASRAKYTKRRPVSRLRKKW